MTTPLKGLPVQESNMAYSLFVPNLGGNSLAFPCVLFRTFAFLTVVFLSPFIGDQNPVSHIC